MLLVGSVQHWSSWSYSASGFPAHISQSNMGDHQEDIQVSLIPRSLSADAGDVQRAPSLEEGGAPSEDRLREAERATGTGPDLPRQAGESRKCSLGFCRAHEVRLRYWELNSMCPLQGFNVLGHCLYLIFFFLSLVLICVLIYFFVSLQIISSRG